MQQNLTHKAKWFFKHLVRDPKWTIRRLIGYTKPPLFSFQMGKVGSSTVKNTLETRYHVCHCHTSEKFKLYQKNHVRENFRQNQPIPYDIITACRDPLGREVSAFFQNIDNLNHSYGVAHRDEILKIPIDGLIKAFFEAWGKGAANTTVWFDRHFYPATGIDIYQHPFDPANGWSIIRDGQWRVLVLRFEDINRNYLEACNAFVTERFGDNAKYKEILPANVSDGKWYGDLMREFKKQIIFKQEQISALYDSPYCKHFYSEKEISIMKSRWNIIN